MAFVSAEIVHFHAILHQVKIAKKRFTVFLFCNKNGAPRRTPHFCITPFGLYLNNFQSCSEFYLFLSTIQCDQLVQVLVSLLVASSILSKQLLSSFRICSLQRVVTNLAVQELHQILGRSLGIQGELGLCCRVEPEQMPVTRLNSQLFLCLSLAHTLLDTMVDTRSVSNDQ